MRRRKGAVSGLEITIAFDLAESRSRIVHHIVSPQDAMLRKVYEIHAADAASRPVFIEIHLLCRKRALFFDIFHAAFQKSTPIFEMIFPIRACDGSAFIGMNHHISFRADHLGLAVVGQYIGGDVIGHRRPHHAQTYGCQHECCIESFHCASSLSASLAWPFAVIFSSTRSAVKLSAVSTRPSFSAVKNSSVERMSV